MSPWTAPPPYPSSFGATPARTGPRWAILDDFYPNLLTGFRVAEYHAYLARFPRLTVQSTLGDFEARHAELAALHPAAAARVEKLSPRGMRRVRFAYLNFLNNAAAYLPILEQRGIPFVMTLYPGGGFGLNEPASDAKLDRVCGSPLLRHVIVTQHATADYLAARHPRVAQSLVFGCVVSPTYFAEDAAPRAWFGAGKDSYDVCFVAEKYMPHGRNKGYPAFVDAARRVAAELPAARFHVVGGFDASDWPLGELAPRMTFHGRLETGALRALLRTIDVVASPNLPYLLHPGNFDGFPTAGCVEAALAGAAMVVSDPLGLNRGRYADGTEIMIAAPDAAPLAAALLALGRDPARLRAIAEAGRARSRALYAPAAQIEPRVAILERAAGIDL